MSILRREHKSRDVYYCYHITKSRFVVPFVVSTQLLSTQDRSVLRDEKGVLALKDYNVVDVGGRDCHFPDVREYTGKKQACFVRIPGFIRDSSS
jgi:hypothetical protein